MHFHGDTKINNMEATTLQNLSKNDSRVAFITKNICFAPN